MMNLYKVIDKIEDIPTIPTILGEILRITSAETTSVKDLCRIIYADQSIATKILKMANSSFYGLAHQVQNIDRAIVILGFDEVKAIAIAMSVFDSLYVKKGGAYYNRMRSWNHSLLCGFGTRLLADSFIKSMKLNKANEYLAELFVAGLIHDIGKVFIDRYFPLEFARILELIEQTGATSSIAEEQILGFDHAFLAGKLLKKWKFPSSLIDMVSHHHQPIGAESHQEWAGLIFLADLMCHHLGYSTIIGEPRPTLEELLQTRIIDFLKEKGLALSPDGVNEFIQKLKDHIQEIEQLSNIFLPI